VPEPLVSAIVPVYCGERFLAAALESVGRQTYRKVELLVVDDGSSDASLAIASAFEHPRKRVLSVPHRGIAGARNAGVAAATGQLIAFLDADDEWLPEKLAMQVELLAVRDDVAAVHAHMRSVLAPGTPCPPWLPAEWLTVAQPSYHPSTWLVRREAFDLIGTFDERFTAGEDFDWLTRAKEAGLTSAMVPRELVHWRAHGANMTFDRDLTREATLAVVRGSVARRRAAARGG
jgi:glycosyltransferase involved in cell wall biosynthesis